MKKTFLFLFYYVCTIVNAQYMYHDADSLAQIIKTKKLSFYNIKMDIYNQTRFFNYDISRSSYNKYVDKKNAGKNYVSYTELQEFDEIYKKHEKYNDIKEDLKYTIYHKYGEKSEVFVKDLPTYAALKKNSYEASFVSCFYKNMETKERVFDFYTSIDSVKVNLSYNFPVEIDTIRLNINEPNKYGIILERYLDYGVIVKFPFKNNYNIIDVVGVDKEKKKLLASLIQKYYTHNSTENENVIKYQYLLSKLLNGIESKSITNTDDLLNQINFLKKELTFNPTSTFKFTINNFIQVFGDADEIILYISKNTLYSSEEYVIKKNKTHPIFEEVEFEGNKYFYDIKNKKLFKSEKYNYIDYLDNNIFEVQKNDDEYNCERIVIDNRFNKKNIGNCNHGRFFVLPNESIVLKETKKDELGEYVKIFDKEGNSKFEGKNTLVIAEHGNLNSNFLVESINEEKSIIIFGDFSKTEELETFRIYSQNRVIIKRGEKYGVLDDFGKLIIPFEYVNIEPLDYETLLVSKGQKQFIINDSNKILFEEENLRLAPIINKGNQIIFDFAYLGLLEFEQNGLKGIKNKLGQIIYPASATEIFEVGINRIAIINDKDKLGVINNKGEVIIPFLYDKINSYYKEYAILINEDIKKFTFYDYDGKIKAQHQAKEFYEIWNLFNKPSLILDDEVIISFDGKLSK